MLPFNLDKIERLLNSFLGPSKSGFSDNGQAQYNCPHCKEENNGIPDNKYNLEVNIFKGVYKCWRCSEYEQTMSGKLSKLVRKYGGNELVNEYYDIVKEIKEVSYYDLELFKDNGEILSSNNLYLPITFTNINLEKCKKKKLVDYLNERHITQDIIDRYNIGYTTWDETKWQMRNRIIIPSYNSDNELNYWLGRDFINDKKSKKTKYKNCDSDKSKIVFQENKIQWCNDIVLVEGGIDCIYYPNAIALLGKVLDKDSETYKQLYKKANANIIICLDGDVKDVEIKRIYNVLNNGRLRGKIWYVKLGTNELPWKDFGEAYESGGKQNIIKILKNKQHYSEIELLI